jgi:hypothetical protein
MMPPVVKEQAPVPPPSYQRAQARLSSALHLDALTLVTTLHLLTLCRMALCLAHRRCHLHCLLGLAELRALTARRAYF